MAWNPAIYNQFKQVRYQPFFDLMELISDKGSMNGVDIGCGTGEQTSLLSQKFAGSSFLGIDASEEMLAESKSFVNEKLAFKILTTEAFIASESKWDLVFSNAALQWSDDHRQLFPALISKIKKGGQLAVQMPFQNENILNKILLDMVSEKPFVDLLNGFCRISPVLTLDEYATIMYQCNLQELSVFLKVYPIIAKSETELCDFISGSALIPYMERLDPHAQDLLRSAFLQRIKEEFKSFPAIYPFKRLLLYGVKK